MRWYFVFLKLTLILLLHAVVLTFFTPIKAQSLDIGGYTKGGAYSYSIPNNTLIGLEQTYTVKGEETLLEIARLFGLGFNEIVDANPDVDPWIPQMGTKIRISTVWILPEAKDEGIVINLAEMRLYYFFEATRGYKMVRTFPIGIGREGIYAPLGTYSITAKVKDPVWYPPLLARKEDPFLPPFITPGPDNPLGGYWLQLSLPGYGIHGTNKPWGIGRRVSRGCIRLYPEDIPWLFKTVKLGSRVEIINQHVKIGYKAKRLYIEIHKNGKNTVDLSKEALSMIKRIGAPSTIDLQSLQRTIEEAIGVPTLISK